MLKKLHHIVFIILLIGTSRSEVAAQHSSYEELQAAYIYNFAKYIKWPQEKEKFVIGVYGGSEIMDFLRKTLEGKKVGNRAIELKVIDKPDSFFDCNIIYVPESDSKNLEELVVAVEGKSILIVTEEDMIRKGAMISFVLEDDRLRFKLKKSSLANAGLAASEGLLKLAIQL